MKNLSLRQRFLLLNTVLILVFVSIGIFTYYSFQKLQKLNNLNSTVHKLMEITLELRKNEKDYLSREIINPEYFTSGESKYINKFNTGITEANEILFQLSTNKLVHTTSIDKIVDQAIIDLKLYADIFSQIQDKTKEMGYKDWGIEGEMRKAIHTVEADFANLHSDRFMNSLLTLRRHEKDFIIRKDEKYIAEFKAEMSKLLLAIQNSGFTKSQSDELINNLNDYTKFFSDYVNINNTIGLNEEAGLKSELREAVHKIEPAIEISKMEVQKLTESKTKEAIIILVIFLLTGAMLGILISFLISKNVFNLLGAEPKLVANIAKDISQGNLSREFDEKLNSTGIMNAFIVMADKLNEVISDILNSSSAIASGSKQLSASSEILSQGANEQAASIEEVSSSMEEMASNIEQNTENAIHAARISNLSANSIIKLREASNDSLESVRKISQKIEIINDISFQTNLLALNAAVEAARAGEHGKGFAVVAAEVRRLAERSKIAAEEIVNLSKSSLSVTENSVEMMTGIMPEIEKTAKLVQEIAAASQEQTNGASQINLAIQQLNMVTQQNASTSEELASSAQEMAAQADRMNDTVSFFTVRAELKTYTPPNKLISKTIKSTSKPIKNFINPSEKGVSLKLSDERDEQYENF